MTKTSPDTKKNIFLGMRPLQRILISLFASLITFVITYNDHLDFLLIAPMLWVVFAVTFIATSFFVFFKLPVSEIEKKANQEDGSRIFVFTSILVSSFASMLTVLLLMLSDKMHTERVLAVVISVFGMIVSWTLVHTIFTFHYANMYYFKYKDNTEEKALAFPGNAKPDYLDFAYFSFVIGMTFQVSDVEISSRSVRRMALFHGLVSFVLNTFVVALTINLVAGLRK